MLDVDLDKLRRDKNRIVDEFENLSNERHELQRRADQCSNKIVGLDSKIKESVRFLETNVLHSVYCVLLTGYRRPGKRRTLRRVKNGKQCQMLPFLVTAYKCS